MDREAIRRVVAPILEALGVELIELREVSEPGRLVLRFLIDREGGVTVGDCERVSREIETPLDVEGLIPPRVLLEVSSPGLNRPLIKEADFARFAGKKVWIRTREAIEGRRNFKGTLEGIEGGLVGVIIDGQHFQVPYRAIDRAELVYEGGKG